jgi:hypothetical protein
MPLNMTKIAFGAQSPQHLRERLATYAQDGEVRLTTRYLPKRVAEMAGGSLYWIHTHTIIGRSPIIGFMENGAGRHWIRIVPQLITVRSTPKRAHQGWRYLTEEKAPRDVAEGEDIGDALPGKLAAKLERLGLV